MGLKCQLLSHCIEVLKTMTQFINLKIKEKRNDLTDTKPTDFVNDNKKHLHNTLTLERKMWHTEKKGTTRYFMNNFSWVYFPKPEQN